MDTFNNEEVHMTDKTQVVATQAAAVAVQANNPMAMIAAAVAKGVDTDQLTKLMDLQERWEKNEARKAFADAMVAFKAEDIAIEKNKDVHHNGKFMYSHATLDNVCRQIISALQKHGISHNWRVDQSEGRVKVSCVLRHRMGHEEAVTLEGAPDTSGAKNAIQAMASTVSYLQRYTLLASTGLAAGIDDTDGGGASGMPQEQYEAFVNEIQGCTKKDKARAAYDRAVKVCGELSDVESKDKLKAVLLAHGKFIDEADKVAA